ncbi:Vam6/Vps39-like protein [Nymphon striatum]|nr:Vam6/Vps39-like protein [Nymphon striatum]
MGNFLNDNLLVGTKQGHLLMYKFTVKKPTGEHKSDLIRSNKFFSKKAICQMELVPDLQILVTLSVFTIILDNVVSIHDMTAFNFPLISTVAKTRGATLFALDIQRKTTETGEQVCIFKNVCSCQKKASEDDPPYLIGILPNQVEVRTIEPRKLIQTLELPKPRYVTHCKKGQVYIASTSHVWCLMSVPISDQITHLEQEKQFELALKLVKTYHSTFPTHSFRSSSSELHSHPSPSSKIELHDLQFQLVKQAHTDMELLPSFFEFF